MVNHSCSILCSIVHLQERVFLRLYPHAGISTACTRAQCGTFPRRSQFGRPAGCGFPSLALLISRGIIHRMPQLIVFTDLDGTLLDAETYAFDASREALDALRARSVPLIPASSKTRAEIERLRADLDHHHPFIVENGGGMFIPKGYFDFPLEGAVLRGPYQVIEFGLPYAALRLALKE